MQLKYLFLPIVLLSYKILSFDFIFETARMKFRSFNNQDFNILENFKLFLKTEKEIRNSWEPQLSAFKKIRKKYLLYKDFE